jgi:hypothetical protein
MKKLIPCIINNVAKGKKGHIYGDVIDGPIFGKYAEKS